MSKAATWRSNIAGRRKQNDCRHWRRTWSPSGGRDRHARRVLRRVRGQSCDRDHSDCFRRRRRPGPLGLVASLNRPGGNLTGVKKFTMNLEPKRLELLHDLVPGSAPSACSNPANPDAEANDERSAGGGSLPGATSSRCCMPATSANSTAPSQGWPSCGPDALVDRDDRSSTAGASSSRAGGTPRDPGDLPRCARSRAGGLIELRNEPDGEYRQFGIYAGRILKGEKPADLPVLQATKVELIINLKTAKALGSTVPLPLLARADEVIE